MNLLRTIGLDIAAKKYSYGEDPLRGYTAAERIPDRWVRTTCGYCSVGCGMYVGVRDGEAVAVRGDEAHPVNRGKLCPKGLSEHHTLHAPDRATRPLVRRDGKLRPVGWNEVLPEMVHGFRSVQDKYGPQSLGVLSTGQLLTEEFYALGKLVQLGFRTSNYCGNTTLCMSSAVAGYKRSFGSDGPPGAYEDFAECDALFLFGANMADNHPILCSRLEHNRAGKTIVVIDPRVTKTAMLADVYLPLKPRTDIALINAMLHVLILEGMIDRAYIDAHTNGFDELAQSVSGWTPARAAEITGLTTDQIVGAARLYGHAERPMLAWTMGVNHSTQGTETVNALCNLSLVTGKIGYPGAAPFSITGQCNAMGTREAGFTSGMPGYRKFEDPKDRAELAALWEIDEAELPAKRGYAYPDIIEAVLRREIRALWIIATNPMVSFPNYELLADALSRLDMLVVQDGFHPTPTTQLAHIVLPAAIWGEKEGTYTNSERRVSKANRALDPPGEALSDFDIFLRVGRELGVADRLFRGWTTPRDAFEEWRTVSKGRLCDYSGISYTRLENEGPLQWPCTEEDGPETRRLYADGKYEFADGRAKLWPVDWQPFPEQPDGEYPLVLNTGRTVEHWHTRTKTGRVPLLERMSPRAWLEMNPDDAQRLGLRPHDKVTVRSRRGAVERVELRVTSIVAPGQVFMPFHFSEWNSNKLTQSAYDPYSREPNFKQCSAAVERTAEAKR